MGCNILVNLAAGRPPRHKVAVHWQPPFEEAFLMLMLFGVLAIVCIAIGKLSGKENVGLKDDFDNIWAIGENKIMPSDDLD